MRIGDTITCRRIPSHTLTVRDYPYASGAKIVQTPLSFEQFLGSLKAGIVVMNIHMTKFNDGEISGKIVAAN